MIQQPELIQPRTLDVSGYDLDDVIHSLEGQGVLISRMARGATNGAWVLTLVWPQRERVEGETPHEARDLLHKSLEDS